MTTLKRTLTLPLITFYGIGTILGAGIYVLIGKVAGHAGMLSPVSFIVAAIIATFTGLSYCELTSRYPKSAGEAVYVKAGFGRKWLSLLTGFLVIATGLVSSAAILNGFVGYFQVFLPWARETIIIAALIILCALAIIGIMESVSAAALITLVEMAGLLFVLFVCRDNFVLIPDRLPEMMPPLEMAAWIGVFNGAFLAFYAYIGFEDMVNVAEEVIEPNKNLPKAIILAIVVSTLIYLLVALVAVVSLNPSELSASAAPLAEIVVKNSDYSAQFISLVSLLAVINGALIQIVMASRVLYGVSQEVPRMALLTQVNQKTRTPIFATLVISLLIGGLALFFPIEPLAKATSTVTLVIFSLVNLSLIKVKMQNIEHPEAKLFPMFVPVTGVILCLFMLSTRLL